MDVGHDDDKAFMANIVAILGALVALAIVIFLISRKFEQPGDGDQASVLERIKPVGEVVVAGTEAAAKLAAEAQNQSQGATSPQSGSTGAMPGKEIYDMTCMACHATGVAGAPKFGDRDAWAARVNEQG